MWGEGWGYKNHLLSGLNVIRDVTFGSLNNSGYFPAGELSSKSSKISLWHFPHIFSLMLHRKPTPQGQETSETLKEN